MDQNTIQGKLYELNEFEIFYRKYYYARQQEYSLKKFLAELDMDYVRKNHLLIQELPETIPLCYEDQWSFAPSQNIACTKHNCYSPAIFHEHTFFELIYVYDGKCTQVINKTSLSIRTGDLCIIPPGVKHSISVFDESIILDILVRKNTLENLFFNFLRDDNILSMFFINSIYSQNVNDYIVFHSGDDFHIKTATSFLLYENINRESYWQHMMTNTLMNVFSLLLRSYSTSVELPVITKKVDAQRFAIIRFIQENYTEINLVDIAERFHYTPEYTSKLIKEATGMTFKQILQKIRLERAESLLIDSNLTIQNICHQVGYENVEHFIRTFRKVNHMTPTEFRRRGKLA